MAADVPYVKYFTSYVYNFQFYKALCLTAGQYNPNDPKKPLHRSGTIWISRLEDKYLNLNLEGVFTDLRTLENYVLYQPPKCQLTYLSKLLNPPKVMT